MSLDDKGSLIAIFGDAALLKKRMYRPWTSGLPDLTKRWAARTERRESAFSRTGFNIRLRPRRGGAVADAP